MPFRAGWCAPFLPHQSDKVLTLVQVDIDGVLCASSLRDGVFPTYQIDMVPQRVRVIGVLFIDDDLGSFPFFLQVPWRSQEHLYDLSVHTSPPSSVEFTPHLRFFANSSYSMGDGSTRRSKAEWPFEYNLFHGILL